MKLVRFLKIKNQVHYVIHSKVYNRSTLDLFLYPSQHSLWIVTNINFPVDDRCLEWCKTPFLLVHTSRSGYHTQQTNFQACQVFSLSQHSVFFESDLLKLLRTYSKFFFITSSHIYWWINFVKKRFSCFENQRFSHMIPM